MYRLIGRIVDFINKRSPVYFLTPRHRAFGNSAEEMYFALLKAQKQNKKAVFIYPRPLLFGKLKVWVANPELYQVQSDHIVSNDRLHWLLAGSLLTVIYLVLREAHMFWWSRALRRFLKILWPKMPSEGQIDYGAIVPSLGRDVLWNTESLSHLSWASVRDENWRRQYEGYMPPHLREDKRRAAEQVRLQMGIPLTDWFVCLHASDTSPPIPRNSSIQNYLKAAKLITSRGGWVVRLGDVSLPPIPPTERVIDYAHSKFKSHLMDLYLISECRFFLGGNSGPPAVAFLFRRPYLLTNLSEWSLALPLNKGDLALTKHIFSRSRNRFLSVKEILEEPFDLQAFCATTHADYVMVENTPEEICEVVEEFLDRPERYEFSDLQQAFQEGRKRQILRGLQDGAPRWPEVSQNGHLTEQYRLASRMDSAGTLGHKYLKKNWLIDELEKAASGRPAKTHVR